MAYPDFISQAPNFAGAFNAIMRSNTDAKAEQMNSWLKSVQAAKLQQDIQTQPSKDMLDRAVQIANIQRMRAVTDRETSKLPGELSEQTFHNALLAVDAEKARKDEADRALAAEYNTSALQISPENFSGDEGTALLKDFVSRANDPQHIYNAQADIVKGNPAYGASMTYAAERRLASPEANNLYKEALSTNGNIDTAMTALRKQSEKEKAERLAETAGLQANAIAKGRTVATAEKLTEPQVQLTKLIQKSIDEDDSLAGLDGSQRGAIIAAVAGEIQKSGGKIEPDKIREAVKKYSKSPNSNAQLDNLFKR